MGANFTQSLARRAAHASLPHTRGGALHSHHTNKTLAPAVCQAPRQHAAYGEGGEREATATARDGLAATSAARRCVTADGDEDGG